VIFYFFPFTFYLKEGNPLCEGRRVCKRYFQTLRHGVKPAFGTLARSACASMANG
jgi:hypothetical protein